MVLMITVVFAIPVALLMELPPLTEVEFEMVVICEDVVWLSWKLPKNETRVPSKAAFGKCHL